MEEQKRQIRDIVAEFFSPLGVDEGFEVRIQENGVFVDVTTDDAGMLIGKGGEHLRALQHVLLLVISRKVGVTFSPGEFTLDINNYQKERIQYLTSLAKNIAHEVRTEQQKKELPPMPASERRIVHVVIAEEGGVITESIGEKRDRRVIVRPEQ